MLLFYKKVTKKLLRGEFKAGLSDCYLLEIRCGCPVCAARGFDLCVNMGNSISMTESAIRGPGALPRQQCFG